MKLSFNIMQFIYKPNVVCVSDNNIQIYIGSLVTSEIGCHTMLPRWLFGRTPLMDMHLLL